MAGLSQPNGYGRQVDMDARKTTTLYDTDATRAQPAGRPTHSYCPTTYDTDADTAAPWTGLAASW